MTIKLSSSIFIGLITTWFNTWCNSFIFDAIRFIHFILRVYKNLNLKNKIFNKMEDKNFSSDSEIEMEFENENENETEMIKSGYFRDLLREKITKCLNEERKKSKKLDKILFDLEIEKFSLALKDIKSKRGRPLKSL